MEGNFVRNESIKFIHLQWIDIVKGIGIICVVYGHIFGGEIGCFIYLFHMPLFFFIGGYLHKPNVNYKDFLSRKTNHLLIPYFIFLTLLFVPEAIFGLKDPIHIIVIKYFYGGRILPNYTGVFWFVTCFFLTQQVFNFLITKYKTKMILGITFCFVLFAYVNNFFFRQILFPWDANVVLYALPIYYCGYIYKDQIENRLSNGVVVSTITIICFIGVSLIFYFANLVNFTISLDMKNTKYGIPVLSFVCGLVIIHFVIMLSKWLSIKNILGIRSIFVQIGKASMLIMYLHQAIQIILGGSYFNCSPLIRFVFALLLPLLLYFLSLRNSILKKIFLGF